MYCRWRSNYQRWRVGITLTSLTPPYFCASIKPGPGYPMSVSWSFMFNDLRREVIARLVDIDRIVDHHCLNFVFIS